MVSRVLNEEDDLSKHLAYECCKCKKCTCGKHKCKITHPKIDLKPSNTTYYDCKFVFITHSLSKKRKNWRLLTNYKK